MKFNFAILVLFWLLLAQPNFLCAAETKAAWQLEWEKTADAAKKEAKIVAGIPAKWLTEFGTRASKDF